jgi:type II secretory pathway component GspD/PulD (secretin)
MKFSIYLLLCFCLAFSSLSARAQTASGDSSARLAADEQTENITPEEATQNENQPLISNVFYETDIRQAIADVAAQAGVSIIVDETVQGMITLEVSNLPLEECLRRILSPFGFTFRKLEGYYLVGSAYPDSPSFSLLSVTELIPLNNLRAKDVPGLLSKFYEPFIRVNEDMDVLTVTASPEIIKRLKKDLAQIDVPLRQVMIEALVTELTKEARKSLGIDASWLAGKAGKSLSVIIPIGDLIDSSIGINYTRPRAEAEGWVGEFKGTLKALIHDGKVKIRANPRVATLEGHKATILIGKEQYYVIATGGAPYYYGQLERIPVGISLQVIPYIAENGDITVDIQPEVSDVVGTGPTGLPVVNKRAASTKVRVKDGETIVIGGLLQKNETTVRKKIPLLGEIPILGLLFSTTDKRVDEIETVIFITPHILTEGATIENKE